MTIKQLAFVAQQILQNQTSTTFRRSHIYELLAAAVGFNSYASLGQDYVFAHGSLAKQKSSEDGEAIGRRCLELEYAPEIALQTARVLSHHLSTQDFGVTRISDLVDHLRYQRGDIALTDDEEFENAYDDEDLSGLGFDDEPITSSVLIEGLFSAAEKENADAHYALALIYDDSDDPFAEHDRRFDFWHKEEQKGRVLDGVEKEWADMYAAAATRSAKYQHHLRAAGSLGHGMALLEVAERFGDTEFFEQPLSNFATVDAARAAEVAEQLGRRDDAWHWWTEAAKQGNTEAMRELIEDYDRSDLIRCWTWFYLAELLGTDLSKDEYVAIGEDGSPYDDDIGGPAFVGGRGGVELAPIDSELEAAARESAEKLYQAIKCGSRK